MTTANDDRLERIEIKVDKMRDELADYQLAVEHRVSVLETKAGFWGAAMGFISGAIAGLLPTFLFRK